MQLLWAHIHNNYNNVSKYENRKCVSDENFDESEEDDDS